jgi:hypothetical protein
MYTAGFHGSDWSLTDQPPGTNLTEVVKKKKKRKSKQSTGKVLPSTSTGETNDIAHTNRYEILSDNETTVIQEPVAPVAPKNHVSNTKNTLTPPIVIRGQNLLTVTNLVKQLKIVNYNVKLMSIGVKIFIQNKSEFENFKKTLIDSKWQFYSYQLEDERLVKYVLYGLHTMDTAELTDELHLHNLNPTNIKTMVLKKQRFDSETLFLVSFKKGQTNLNELRKTKALFNIIVRWEQYSPKRKNNDPPPPVQCRRCQMFGHGALNCHMNPRCIRCGESHQSKNCIYVQSDQPSAKIPEERVKCSNCGENHTANHPSCTERQRYLNVIQTIRDGNTQKSGRRPPPKAAPAVNNTQHFPLLTPSGSSEQRNVQPSPVAANTNHTNWSKKGSNNTQNQTNSNDDLSAQEINQIMRELIVNLRGCRTRWDQLEVITNLAMKFVENGP